MSKILITGANGLLGQAIVSIFTRESNNELILTSTEAEPFIDFGHKYYSLDITNRDDLKKVIGFYEPEVIVNCAAFTDVDGCEIERELCWKVNVDGVKNLVITCRGEGIKIIHYSTDYIFDGKSGPYSENSKPNPLSFYGRSKLASENVLTSSGIDYAIIRTMVLYGIGKNVKSNFALWLINELKNGREVRIADDMIGNVTNVDDLAYGTLKIIEGRKKGIYNIAGKDIISRYDFALKLCEVFNYDKNLVKKIETKALNQAAPRPLKSGLITLKAETELNLRLMDSIDGLRLLKYQLGY